MTRSEFISRYTYEDNNICDLAEFGRNNEIEYFENLIDGEYYFGEQIDDDIREFLRYNSWTELRDALNSIEEGYDWYVKDGAFPYVQFDEDRDTFEEMKQKIIDEFDENGWWDEEEEIEEEEIPNPVEEAPAEEITEEDMFDMDSLDGLYSASSGIMQIIAMNPTPEPVEVAAQPAEEEIVLCDDELLF